MDTDGPRMQTIEQLDQELRRRVNAVAERIGMKEYMDKWAARCEALSNQFGRKALEETVIFYALTQSSAHDPHKPTRTKGDDVEAMETFLASLERRS